MELEDYSVLMSVYAKDNPSFLKESIDSMLHQTICTNDFIIVEDGPLTKELSAILDDYSIRYPIIHRVPNEINKGLAAALNQGLNECKNRLVARMDSDDVSSPHRCEEQLKRFYSNPELSIVGTDMVEFEYEISNVVSIKKMPSTADEIRKYSRRRSPFNHPSVMYDKTIILDQFGGYNVNNHRAEDFELFSTVVFSGYQCENISDKLFYYRTDLSQIKRRFNWTSFKSVVSTEYKNYKRKYVAFSDLMYVFCAQSFGLLCPSFLLKKIMLNHFRQSNDIDCKCKG